MLMLSTRRHTYNCIIPLGPDARGRRNPPGPISKQPVCSLTCDSKKRTENPALPVTGMRMCWFVVALPSVL